MSKRDAQHTALELRSAKSRTHFNYAEVACHMEGGKAITALKQLCLHMLRDIMENDKLPLLSIPKANGVGEMFVTRPKSLAWVNTSRSYAEICSVMNLISSLVTAQKMISLRDIYYSLKYIFKLQQTCNTRILECGSILGLKRYEMNITAASKGYIAGRIKFKFQTNSNETQWNRCVEASMEGGIAISFLWTSCNIEDISVELETTDGAFNTSIRYLVVVEKEGIYKRLCEDNFHSRLGCILVTGCGFPDIATRSCVSKLVQIFPHLQVLGICDYNPFGVALLYTYKMGSVNMAFEGSGCKVPQLRWLGLRHTQTFTKHSQGPICTIPDQCLDRLSVVDYRKIKTLKDSIAHHMKAQAAQNTAEFCSYLHELDMMSEGGVKCELEALYTMGYNTVANLFEKCILSGDFI